MIYNYDFFEKFLSLERLYKCPVALRIVGGGLYDLYKSEEEALKHCEVLVRPKPYDFETPALVRAKGAYCKGGQSTAPLATSMNTQLPEDFVQFYEKFGETMIFTRAGAVWILSLQEMIDQYQDDPDITVREGRFFRFANFPNHTLWLGFRRHDLTDAWEIVVCDYGLLYSEMIGPQGRETVLAPSFYEWLKDLIETDGDLGAKYPRYPFGPDFLVVVESDKA